MTSPNVGLIDCSYVNNSIFFYFVLSADSLLDLYGWMLIRIFCADARDIHPKPFWEDCGTESVFHSAPCSNGLIGKSGWCFSWACAEFFARYWAILVQRIPRDSGVEAAQVIVFQISKLSSSVVTDAWRVRILSWGDEVSRPVAIIKLREGLVWSERRK